MLDTEEFACSCDPSLDFVCDKEHLVLVAQFANFGEVVVIRDNNSRVNKYSVIDIPCLALNRLYEERGDFISMPFKGFLQVLDIVISDSLAC